MTNSRLLPIAILLLALFSLPASAQTVTTFEGIDASQVSNPQYDVDPNGAVGTRQFMEWTNAYFQAFDKTTFAPVWSTPQAASSPWKNKGINSCNAIQLDGMVLFDRLASRWVIAAHTSQTNNYNYCVAVSNTDDLTSPSLVWYTYVFPLNSALGTNAEGDVYFPDWPKIATWSNGYYVAFDLNDVDLSFREVGVLVCALDRSDMLVNGTAIAPICFRSPNPVTTSIYLGHSLIPADVEGTTPPPAGRDEFLTAIQNPVLDGSTITSTTLNLWDFYVNWSNPGSSTLTPYTLTEAAYQPGCYTASQPTNTVCVPEPSTAQTKISIDSVGDRFMPRMSYRNFGSYESFVVSHTVQVGTSGSKQTGIRWYELRDGGSGLPSIYQDGNISPDTSLYRFLPSMAEDSAGNAAVGYSVSSSSTNPGINASYFSLTNSTAPTELSLYAGTGSQEGTWHWGSYDGISVDPVDGCTFWFADEYFANNQIGTEINWNTRIANFKLPTCGSVTLAPTSLTFTTQAVGTTSPAQNITLTNSQSVTLNISGVTVSGANNTDFSPASTCGSSVVAGGSCTIGVTFTPGASGTRTATLDVNDDAPNSPQTVSLTGTGSTGPILSFSPTSINFGNQITGTTSGVSAIQVTNSGGSAATFTSILITGNDPGDFAESDNCQPTLPAQQSCTVNITFTPQANGTRSASVTFTDNAPKNKPSPQNVSLSGVGVAPVTLSTASISFGTVLVDSSSTAPAVTLTNNQSIVLANISISLTGSSMFSQVNTCGSSIPALGQCTITVTFAPTAAGAQTGTVTITDSAGNSPQTISLTGTGQQPVVMSPTSLSFGNQTVGTTSPAKTITVGNNEKVTLTFTSVAITGKNSGDFAIQTNTCSVVSAGAKCTVTVTFTPTAKGNRSATLTLTDGAATSPQTANLTGVGK